MATNDVVNPHKKNLTNTTDKESGVSVKSIQKLT